MRVLALLVLWSVGCAAQDEEHGAWEWAGAFDLHEEEPYTLSFAPNEAHMKMLYVSSTSATAQSIEEVEGAAEALWDDGDAVEVDGRETVLEHNVLYELHLDPSSYLHLYTISAPAGNYVLFFEHLPSELEREGLHWLKDAEGHDVEAESVEVGHGEHEDEHDDDSHDNESHDDDSHNEGLGEVVLACALITALSAVGLVFIAPCMARANGLSETARRRPVEMGNAFASGALLSTMIMLMVPEASELMSIAHPGEMQYTSRMVGATLLLGFVSVGCIEWVANCTGVRSVASFRPTTFRPTSNNNRSRVSLYS